MENIEELKQQAKQEYEERQKIYATITENPSLASLADHVVNLYESYTQGLRHEIIQTAMFKTVFDVLIEAKLTTHEDFDAALAANIREIESAYTKAYEEFASKGE